MSTILANPSQALLTSWPSGPLRGTAAVPGDKSISHRALILGGMAEGVTRIDGLLEGDDVLRTAEAVRAFGAVVERVSPGCWTVEGKAWRSPDDAIDCGNSGTGARLLMGASAGFPLEAVFTGDASLRRRPMDRVLAPLRQMGAEAHGSTLPVRLRGGSLGGIRFVNEAASAQVKSAILLAGLRAAGEVEVIEPFPSRDHTENMLRAFGCEIERTPGRVRLGADRTLRGTDIEVPGDPSSAAFPLVAALLVPDSSVIVTGVMMNPLRAGLFETLIEMGADLRIEHRHHSGGEPIADVTARASRLRGVEVPADRAPAMIDEYPILAMAAACAEGRSVMHGLAELRVKECDRLAAIVAGLNACGVEAWEDGDSLVVEGCGGRPAGGAAVAAQDDHRIAMSFLVLGLAAARDVTVDSADMIGTSFPDFEALMHSLGGEIS